MSGTRSPWQWLAAALAFVAALAIGHAGWQRWHQRYAIEVNDDGVAVARVVAEQFATSASLRVATLSGIVQSTASDTRGFGLLTSERVAKAPFSVDYFVDAARIGPDTMRWDAATRTLLVDAPDVTVGRPNVDEAHRTVERSRGLFVTRGAFENLSRATALKAQNLVDTRARDPEHVAMARDNARVVIATLLHGPLQAAGLRGVRIKVRLAGDARAQDDRRWDVSRSLEDVLGNAT